MFSFLQIFKKYLKFERQQNVDNQTNDVFQIKISNWFPKNIIIINRDEYWNFKVGIFDLIEKRH